MMAEREVAKLIRSVKRGDIGGKAFGGNRWRDAAIHFTFLRYFICLGWVERSTNLLTLKEEPW
jgi:hypothetical protein